MSYLRRCVCGGGGEGQAVYEVHCIVWAFEREGGEGGICDSH